MYSFFYMLSHSIDWHLLDVVHNILNMQRTVFSAFSNIIKNDLIATISDVVRYDIKEISAAPFVAAEVNESTDVTKLRSLSSCG